MEKLLSILKQLMGQGSVLGNIPKPVKMGVMYFGVFVGVIVILKSNLDPSVRTFLIIAIIMLAIVTALYFGWKAWKQKQQNQQLGGEISQHSAGTPRGVSAPGQLARLDDMRKKFQSGVEAYKSRGKDLYKLPWYVIVGEPGSGKTEAIRHSNIGFPPGMQDEFQGVGGTINMNWWFTNQAVLLDTAGRLMFEEVKPGETNEWKEFLNLLKKNRPNCPINGLFLVIPSDSLIKDSADAIQKKAGKIAQQLDVIQRILDVRFPVFIVVTKCDKINGFREFFDGLDDPQLQHQMVGWSNPTPLDEPFKPELVGKHLEQVAARLARRRLGLLRDPVPESSEGRRTDEVDSLFALPHSLDLISSRLRRYLETIFIAGEWSAKPLFLRGIYLSSSMREGAALDAELAEAIGVGVDELPEGKFWERERAYFLRDLFVEKVFREKGIVTRASNTKQMLRGQQVALFGFGFAALAVFLAVAWLAMSSFKKGVQSQGAYWEVVRTNGWDANNYWKQSIVPLRADGSFDFRITNTIAVGGKDMALGEFHAKLRDLVQQELKNSILAQGMAKDYNTKSKHAQEIVFEDGVVRPLIDATRQKMKLPRTGGEPLPFGQAEAFTALIKLESEIPGHGGGGKGTLTEAEAGKFLGALESFVAGANVTPDTNLVAVMSWTYTTNAFAKGSWPPAYLNGHPGEANALGKNPALYAGLELFLGSATNEVQKFGTSLLQIQSLRGAAQAYGDAEAVLFRAAQAGVEDDFIRAQAKVSQAGSALDKEVRQAKASPVFDGGALLTKGWQTFNTNVTTSASAALGSVRQINGSALADHPAEPLFKEIDNRLREVDTQLKGKVTEWQGQGNMAVFQELDNSYLAENSFSNRANYYEKLTGLATVRPLADGNLVGSRGAKLEGFVANSILPLKDAKPKCPTGLATNFDQAVQFQLNYVQTKLSNSFFTEYLNEAQGRLKNILGFPIIRNSNKMMTVKELTDAVKILNAISNDLASPALKNVPPGLTGWDKFKESVTQEQLMASGLADADGHPGNCTISLAADDAGRYQGWGDAFRDFQLVVGDSRGVLIGVRSHDKLQVGEASLDKKLGLEFFHNVDSKVAEKIIGVSEWGPLRLIEKYSGERVDATTWAVGLPGAELGASGTIRLLLKFEHPLPNLENWKQQ